MKVINLTALAETRSKMTPGELVLASVADGLRQDQIVALQTENDVADLRGSLRGADDAAGLVAEHNAMPVLFEVARAALRLRAAAIALRAAHTEGNAIALATAAAEERLALDSYDAALAKVSL